MQCPLMSVMAISSFVFTAILKGLCSSSPLESFRSNSPTTTISRGTAKTMKGEV